MCILVAAGARGETYFTYGVRSKDGPGTLPHCVTQSVIFSSLAFSLNLPLQRWASFAVLATPSARDVATCSICFVDRTADVNSSDLWCGHWIEIQMCSRNMMRVPTPQNAACLPDVFQLSHLFFETSQKSEVKFATIYQGCVSFCETEGVLMDQSHYVRSKSIDFETLASW